MIKTRVASQLTAPVTTSAEANPEETATSVKTFVVDTNVLLHNPKALFLLADNEIVIPIDVIEELDTFKTSNDDLGRNARMIIRQLDQLRGEGSLSEGVTIQETRGVVRIAMMDEKLTKIPAGLDPNKPDNRIIACAYNLKMQGKRVVFISKDTNARIKGDALGLVCEDFEALKVDFDTLYTGYREVMATTELIDTFYRDKELNPADLALGDKPLLANEYVIFKDPEGGGQSALGKYRLDIERIVPLKPRRAPTFGVMPRNVQQTIALDLLLDDQVKLVSLVGGAGTGKTLLALAAGMQKVLTDETYHKMLCARPIMPLGKDIGYLPGDKDEKLGAWMQPIFDNVSYLLSSRLNEGKEHGKDAGNHNGHNGVSTTVEQKMTGLIAGGKIVMEPLTYIRGRSIPQQFIIVDEAQNLTPHEVKTIASRVGEGTKLVFTGDATQIDNPYLDSSSNGLSYLVERLKGKAIVGHMTLAKSERSELARLVTAEL